MEVSFSKDAIKVLEKLSEKETEKIRDKIAYLHSLY